MFADEQMGMRNHDQTDGSECREKIPSCSRIRTHIYQFLTHRLRFMHFEHRINTLLDATHTFPPVLCLTYERGGKMQQRQHNSDRESGCERGSQSVGMREGGGIWFPWQHAEG